MRSCSYWPPQLQDPFGQQNSGFRARGNGVKPAIVAWNGVWGSLQDRIACRPRLLVLWLRRVHRGDPDKRRAEHGTQGLTARSRPLTRCVNRSNAPWSMAGFLRKKVLCGLSIRELAREYAPNREMRRIARTSAPWPIAPGHAPGAVCGHAVERNLHETLSAVSSRPSSPSRDIGQRPWYCGSRPMTRWRWQWTRAPAQLSSFRRWAGVLECGRSRYLGDEDGATRMGGHTAGELELPCRRCPRCPICPGTLPPHRSTGCGGFGIARRPGPRSRRRCPRVR